ncbi:site-specific DNA-methyltransferase [Rhodococcoides fascians]|uniref:site-specific DNA-methyltransferase n=1 Tax=Rhodococcoides fascians TaxID=1828 RepID=UPI000689C71E|nr:site-specific DNA-methyltransferase [Rhodococcus fascians]
MTDEIYETRSTSPNFQTELVAKLADLIPEAISDGKVDVHKLKELLDGDAADSNERFGLYWPGQKRALRAAQEPTTATLRPDIENSNRWDTTKNVFIEGDNLEVLKILQTHYHAKIKLIYIDPPYNTGKDFVYPDNYKEGLDTYLEWTRQVNEEGKRVTTNADTEGRYHSNWLNMMYPRLKLARNLLTDDGVILISIDDNEVAHLRKVCDQIFGEQNFIASIVWQGGRKNDSRYISVGHDYLLIYVRNEGWLRQHETRWRERKGGVDDVLNKAKDIWKESGDNPTVATKRFRSWLSSQSHLTSAVTRFKTIDQHGRVYNADKDLSWPGGGGPKYEVLHPVTGKPVAISSRGWGVTKEKLNELIAADLVEFGADENKIPRGKTFLEELDDQVVESVFTQIRTTAAQRLARLIGPGIFDFPKDEFVLARWLKLAAGTDQDATILDFFAGSGSTAHAVMMLNAEDGGNRRVISVQLPEPTPAKSGARSAGFNTIADIARERIRRAAVMISEERAEEAVERDAPLDIGFRAYKLADTNFSKWRLSSDVDVHALEQHLLSLRDSATDNATADELLTEILLKQGYSLTEAVSACDVGGLDVRVVRDSDGDVALLAYLNEQVKPTLDDLRALVDQSPTRIIVLEDSFQGDDELKTNLAQLAKSKGIELWTA